MGRRGNVERRRAAAKLYAETGNAKQSFLKAGFSPATAAGASQLYLKAPSFIELVNEYLPADRLLEVHSAGLNATKKEPRIIDRDKRGAPVYDYVEEPDFNARHKYLETAYKITSRLNPEERNGNTVMIVNIDATLAKKYGIKTEDTPIVTAEAAQEQPNETL